MNERLPFIITISRQLGSGGSYIGQKLADQLGISYLDKEIIKQASKELGIAEEQLELRDEKERSWWDSFLKVGIYNAPMENIPPQLYLPSEYDLYETEANIITRIAKNYPAVIVGRCGSYVLRDFSRHLSVFLHADADFRNQRIRELYKVDEIRAKKMIEDSDKSRLRYHRDITGREWMDARQYHLSLDTGHIGLDMAKDIIVNCVKEHFGE
ncbi:MAG: cytidylate kinase-like family protein [Clostridiales bacterium]|nr:cytidylate kinase-like family protein [Clostridiales bacterium]